MILEEVSRVTVRVCHRIPNATGLVRLNGRPSHLTIETAANIEGFVAKHFPVQSVSRAASEIAIVRIDNQFFSVYSRVLAIGCRHDHLLDRSLDVPSIASKICGEPIEKVRMGGPIAFGTQITIYSLFFVSFLFD